MIFIYIFPPRSTRKCNTCTAFAKHLHTILPSHTGYALAYIQAQILTLTWHSCISTLIFTHRIRLIQLRKTEEGTEKPANVSVRLRALFSALVDLASLGPYPPLVWEGLTCLYQSSIEEEHWERSCQSNVFRMDLTSEGRISTRGATAKRMQNLSNVKRVERSSKLLCPGPENKFVIKERDMIRARPSFFMSLGNCVEGKQNPLVSDEFPQ